MADRDATFSGTEAPESTPYRLDDLVGESRWVAWRQEKRTNRDGGTFATKIPFDPHSERPAKIPTDPNTYGTREAALSRWRQLDNGSPGGIGIVLGDIDGVCLMGIDLDGCLDPATQEVAEWPMRCSTSSIPTPRSRPRAPGSSCSL